MRARGLGVSSAQRFFLGFVITGVLMLLAHPRSRPMMAYAFQPDRARVVLATNPLSNEPFEFFPPWAAEMDKRKRYLAAFRIVRRLRSDWIKPDGRDLRIVKDFIAESSDLDPDNAYWPQLSAAILSYAGDARAPVPWRDAISRGRWDTGEAEALWLLWDDLAAADRVRLAWQGVVALDHASEGPGHFIVENVRGFAYQGPEARYTSLSNAAVILESARSFSTASAAIELADRAVFGRVNPIAALGQRAYEEAKTAFPRMVAERVGPDEGEQALRDIQTVESWQSFYRSGAPRSRSTMKRLRLESLLTAAFPSSLLMASLCLLGVGLAGTLVAGIFGPLLNPDRRVILSLGVLTAALLWYASGVFLLAVWALTIAGVLSIPQMIARDEPIDWRGGEKFAVVCVALLGMGLLTISFLQESSPALRMSGRHMDGSFYGAVGGVVLSLSLPCAAVWARLRRVSMMRAAGETLRLLGFSGAIVGLAATVVLSPFALWRDAANRVLLEQWIRSEPATFRPDAPQ